VTKEDIEKELLNYFQDLLSEPVINRHEAISKITEAIPRLVPPEQSQSLMRPTSLEEVEVIVKSMAPGKSPGPDGFTPDFFQVGWPVLGNDIWEVVEESHKYKSILQAFNATFITLIPNIKGTCSTDKFFPISLCNVIYKIISKLIASRLKPILPLIISQEQGGFVEGRKILDGIIVSHEAIHSLKVSKKVGMMMKLDMSKAYDRMNWDFLHKMLLAFGFGEDWVAWVMNLVSTTFFSILVNGSPSKTFNVSRGLRQGDPMSPFLYIILVEGLGHNLSHAKRQGRSRG
jgi:hypothetical protein